MYILANHHLFLINGFDYEIKFRALMIKLVTEILSYNNRDLDSITKHLLKVWI